MGNMSQSQPSEFPFNDTSACSTVPATHLMSTRTQQLLKPSTGSPPTLLNITQELRDIIFAYVFNTTDPTGTVALRILPCEPSPEDSPADTLSASAAPPPKHPLLVCRQLYTELKPAHMVAYRRFWTAQRFHITKGPTRPYNPVTTCLPSESDLRHIRHFAIAARRCHSKMLINFRFEPTSSTWSVFLQEPERALQRRELPRQELFLQSYKDVMGWLRKDADGVPIVINPTAGEGLDSKEINELFSLVWQRT